MTDDPLDRANARAKDRATPAGADRETQVLDAVVSLVDSLLDDFDVVELLTDLTEQCARLLAVTAAGMLLAGPDHDLRLITATSDRAADLELFQLQAQEGPCLESFRTGRAVSVADLRAASPRWPSFTESALRAGFAAVHAIPMRAAGTVLGALGLFATSAGDLAPPDRAVGQTLAHVASVAILQEHAPSAAQVPPRLQNVLTRQIVVEQAKGFVHDSLDVPLAETTWLLRDFARRRGEHLSDVCRTMMSDRDRRDGILDGLRGIRDAAGI